MNPLQLRLAALRRRLRLVVTFRGVSVVLAILLAAAVAAGLLDWHMPGHLPSLVRAVLLVSALTFAGCVAYRHLLRPLWANAGDLSLALRVESRYPALNDALASAVQFLEQPADAVHVDSPSLRQQAVERALHLAKGLDFNPVVDARGIRAAGLSLALATIFASALILAHPRLAWTAFFRLTDPFGGHEWPRQTLLEINAPSRVARGEAFEIHGRVRGLIPERAHVEFRFQNAASLVQEYSIGRPDSSEEGRLTVRLEAARVQHNFRFQVRASDAVSGWHEVAVFPPPQLVPLAGRPSPQIQLHFPKYTDLPAVELPDGTSIIEAAAGTQVHLRAAADRALVRAWLEYPVELEPALTLAAFLNPLAVSQPTGALELAGAYLQVWRRIPAGLEDSGRVLTLDFTARVSGTFGLHFEDELGLANTRRLELHTLSDPAPTVHLERPSRSRDSLDVLPDAEITLAVLAEDPRYAIRSVYLTQHQKRQETPQPLELSASLSLYDHAALGEALPPLLTALTGSPVPVAPAGLRLRPTHLEIGRRWSLSGLKLREGDNLILQACADDFDDETVGKTPGYSQEVELRIVSRTALDISLGEAQAQVQQELVRLQKQQQEALAKVVPAETYLRNQRMPLQPKHFDELLQAEQLQQQIQARVGSKQEGLRAEVGRILQTLQDNHLPRTGTQDRMETVAGELDRLVREELSQIEPQLTEARKQSEVQAPSNSTRARRDNPLSEARRHQAEVEKTLSELLKLLEPWSSTREVKGEAKSILQEQRKLAEQTAGLAQEIPLNAERDALKASQQTELEQAEESQRDLAERASRLLQKLRRLATDRASRDPDTSKQLGEAANRGEETEVTAKMQEAEQEIHKLQLSRAGQQQLASARAMEEVVRALEEHRDEDLDRLIKKMKEMEQALADLTEEQDRLREKAKQASQIADPTKRKEALKRLAREQAQLQRQTRELVRTLSRLRAERASQALGRASSEMQRAGQQLERGENSDGEQEELLERLNEAQQKLREAREEVEEELAREKLAKLADLIKGLRQRQESLLAESARIHREVLQLSSWPRRMLASLRSLADAQHGLGEETDRMAKEKLMDAKVFAYLLDKAGRDMDQASGRMLERLDKAQEQKENAPAVKPSTLDLLAEQAADAEIQSLQRRALQRIDRLLEALEANRVSAQRPPPDKGSGDESGGGGGGPGPGSERIPPLAQLKVLRSLQQEVNERTTAFDKEHPDRNKLTNKDEQALQALGQEQLEIADLFQQLTAPTEIQEDKK
jgi:hypothetical protein